MKPIEYKVVKAVEVHFKGRVYTMGNIITIDNEDDLKALSPYIINKIIRAKDKLIEKTKEGASSKDTSSETNEKIDAKSLTANSTTTTAINDDDDNNNNNNDDDESIAEKKPTTTTTQKENTTITKNDKPTTTQK